VNGSKDRLVLPALVVGAVLAGGNGVGVRFSNRELDPLWGAGLRFALAAALLVAAMAALRLARPRGRAAVGAVLYGALNFPLQMAILLSAPGREFTGGEFVLAEQRPRTQLRAEVVPLGQGEAVIFAVNFRPARGARGFYRLSMRHGVSRIRSGERYTLGIIFHDAA